MAYVKTDDTHYGNIAGAIRALHDGSETYTPAEMAAYLSGEGAGLKPWNIAKGITIFGVTGTLDFAPSSDWPDDLPIDEGDADDALDDFLPSDGDGDGSGDGGVEDKGDKFVLADGKGNVTIAYMIGDAFTITSYDYATTEFKAIGWIRLSYHTTGEYAGQFTLDDFRTTESGGWNYLKNIRSCTREKLYYKGNEIWPYAAAAYYLYNDVKLPALPAEIKAYPYQVVHYLTGEGSTILAYGLAQMPVTTVKTTFLGSSVSHRLEEGVTYRGAGYYAADGWIVDEAEGNAGWTVSLGRLIWANYDVLDENGDVYLAASDPIPVYE